MARLVLNNASITINSVDLSDRIAAVTITTEIADIPTTAFGDTAVTRIAGLKDSSIQIDFHQDFAATEVEATIYPLLGTTTTVLVKPTSAAVSATNPSYSMSCLVTSWTPIAGAVGELLTASVTWPVSGEITKATT
jgi:hypothetical protein